MGALGRIDPWAAIWVPYVFFCAFCYWMFHTLTKPGGQPIGALERVFSKASAGIVRLIVRRRPLAAESCSMSIARSLSPFPSRTIALYTARMRSEEHTSELHSLMRISYDVFYLKKKTQLH